MSESPTEHFEHAEHAEHVAHSGDPFLAKVSITIAALAVLARGVVDQPRDVAATDFQLGGGTPVATLVDAEAGDHLVVAVD